MSSDSEKKTFRRFRLVLALLTLWMLAAAGKSFYLAGPGREKIIAAGEAFARFEGKLPAARGRILDKNGVTLAWSEFYYDLHSDVKPDETELDALRRIFPDGNFGHSGVLRRHLTPDELLALETAIRNGARFFIRPRVERIVVNSPNVRSRIGKVERIRGVFRGVSGYEQRFDDLLRGTPGRFRVLRDRYKNWLPKSFELKSQPVPGRDIRLDVDLTWLERDES